jgi:hypothetical protein
MGIMSRKLGEQFVVTNDRMAGEPVSNTAPKRPVSFRVWTSTGWSAELEAATTFPTLDLADEFVRANYAKVSV